MKFLILLICLLLQAFFKQGLKKNRQLLVDQYISSLKPLLTKFNLNHSWKGLVGLLLPALIVVLLLNALFLHVPVLYFFYSLLILWFCLDLRDIKSALAEYFTAFANENLVRAQVEAEQFAMRPLSQNSNDIARAVTITIFENAIAHLFSVIFWFMAMGPFGAVLYFLTTAIAEKSQHNEAGFSEFQVAGYLKAILDWIPVRLVTFTFALISHFGPVFTIWLERLGGGLSENEHLLLESGLTAIDKTATAEQADVVENHHALGLVTRTLWTWLIVIALFSVASWL